MRSVDSQNNRCEVETYDPPDIGFCIMNLTSNCTCCGAAFSCGMEAGDDSCWCVGYPKVEPAADVTSCLCPVCLQRFVAEQVGRATS
jgi:hypothetical protein